MSDINIHNIEFLKTVRAHVAEKMTVPGLSKKWFAAYAALIAVLDRLIRLVDVPAAQ